MKNPLYSRREFLKKAGLGIAAASFAFGDLGKSILAAPSPPNIIYILADDLGYRELGCYGQAKIKTPNIDRLAAEGMRFTQHYSGSPVCAPSRCSLLTGKHTGHAYIRDNDELKERGDVWHDPELEGQRPLLPNTSTIGTLLQKAGYRTGCIGKWGLGGPKSTGHPNKQGFDHFFGYLCQRVAHNYYPTHLWRNTQKVMLEGNEYLFPHKRLKEDQDSNNPEHYQKFSGKHYAPDLMLDEAIQFIRAPQKKPFFLMFSSAVPHVALQVPDDSLQEYQEAFPETPYRGEKGYLPHRTPRAAYAAMISRLDRDIGKLLAQLKESGQDQNTLVIFSSDNGPTYAGGVDYEFFKSAGELRGLKGEMYEGGIRVPMIARWPGQIKAGSTSDHLSAFWDLMPTFCELAGTDIPGNTDGISFAPTLLGKGTQQTPKYLYWEFPSYGGQQAVRMGKWKGYIGKIFKGNTRMELYDIENDAGEQQDLSAQYPVLVKQLKKLLKQARVKSDVFPFKPLDGA